MEGGIWLEIMPVSGTVARNCHVARKQAGRDFEYHSRIPDGAAVGAEVGAEVADIQPLRPKTAHEQVALLQQPTHQEVISLRSRSLPMRGDSLGPLSLDYS